MKTKILTVILVLTLAVLNITAQNPGDENAIKETITKFVISADQQDEKALEILLDNNFRLSLNQMFGSSTIILIDKQGYLNKIKAKEFGGDKREVKIENLIVVNNNASVKATFKGGKMTIVTLLQLIKSANGEWKILNDLPQVL